MSFYSKTVRAHPRSSTIRAERAHISCAPTDRRCASAVRDESLGARSTVVGFHVVGVQTVEELPDRPLGSEHVKGHMLPVLRNDLVFALRF